VKTYRPGTPPSDPAQMPGFLRQELANVQAAANRAEPYVLLQTLHTEPVRMFGGMLVLADGSDWNPGYGTGMYQRNEANDAWIFIATQPYVGVVNAITPAGGTLAVTGALDTSLGLNVGATTNANHGIELGYTGGSASTPYIDLHSGATAVDYDVRLIASGGSGASGGGTLSITAANVAISNLATVGSLRVNVTPAAETPAATHTAVINFNGTNYKVLCVPA
jgi:hypothetical protein